MKTKERSVTVENFEANKSNNNMIISTSMGILVLQYFI